MSEPSTVAPDGPLTPDARRSGWQALALTLIVLGLGLSAWIPWRDQHPNDTDAMRWVTEANVETAEWWTWVFFRRHFIGYRPVTAASFTLNSVVSGWEPWSYRLLDSAVHAWVGVFAWLLYRSWTGDRSWWSLLVPTVFFLHPATEDVVPHLARRSYSLASLFGVLSLVMWTRAVRGPTAMARWAWGLAAAVVLGLGLNSNEVAYVVAGVLPFVALWEAWRGGAWARVAVALVPQLGVAAASLVLRYVVLGHFGGYHKRYFAFARGGKDLLRELDEWAPIDILLAALRYVAFPSYGGALDLLQQGRTVTNAVVVLVVVGSLAWWCTGRAWLRRAAPEAALAPLLLLWIVGYALLYAITGSWFWRQAYPMLIPASMLLGLMIRGHLTDPLPLGLRERAHGWLRAAWRVAAVMPPSIVVLSLAWQSPGIWGMDAANYRGDRKHNAMLERMRADFEAHLSGRTGVVFVVLPTNAVQARSLRVWLFNLLGEGDWPDVTFIAENAEGSRTRIGEPLVALEVDPSGRQKLVLASSLQWADRPARLLMLPPSGRVWLDRVRGVRRDDVWVYSQADTGSILLEVPFPAPRGTPAPQPSAPTFQGG